MNEQTPLEWSEATRFESGSLIAIVSEAQAGRYTRFSMRLWSVGKDPTKLYSNISARTVYGSGELEENYAQDAYTVLSAAQDYIRDRISRRMPEPEVEVRTPRTQPTSRRERKAVRVDWDYE